MKKLLFVLLVLSSSAYADPWRHGGGHYVYRQDYGWVVPSIIGGVVGYGIARSQQPNTVYVPAPVAPPPNYYPPAPPYGYHWEAILDGNCNCYRTVAVPN